jgi:phage host-nuclease inhibitor protein Gam
MGRIAMAVNANSVIAVKKKRQMSNPGIGKLHPLFCADGSLIQDLLEDFPNAGELFAVNGFDTLPDDLLEVRYETNTPGFGAVSEDHPTYSHYIVRLGTGRNTAVPTEKFGDIVELDQFPEFGQELILQFKVTKYFFVQSNELKSIRGPYRVQEAKPVDEPYWSVKVMPAYPTDQICRSIPLLKDQILVEFTAQDLEPTDIVAFEGLAQYDLDYDERTIVSLSAVFDLVTEGRAQTVDAMSDNDLLDWGRRVVSETTTVDRNEAKRLRDLIVGLREQRASSSIPLQFMESRIERLTKVLQDSEAIKAAVSGLEFVLLERYVATPEGKELLDRHFNDRKPQWVEELRKEVLNAESKRIEDMWNDARKDLAGAQVERDALIKEIDTLKERSSRLSQIKLEELTEQHRTMQKAVQQLKEDEAYYSRRIDALKAEVKGLTATLQAGEDQIRSRLADQKRVLDALTGLGQEKDRVGLPSFVIPNGVRDRVDKATLVSQVHDFLSAQGRGFSLADTANLLASVVQNRFTILAGYPGVGKTSLAMLLGKALGLRPAQDPRRIIKINVGRGWVSSRDLVGVFNPISQQFSPADSGLFHGLVQLNTEVQAGGATAPLWVLLDEMNLSSVEHYLSDFIAQADDDEGEVTYGRVPLRYDRALRFIGTVNYDETTETISPRMLSRASVIYIAPPKSRHISSQGDLPEPPSPPPITMDELEPFWGARPEFEDDVDEEVKFKELATYMEQEYDEGKRLGRPIILDSRVILAIKRFCNATRDIISPERGRYGSLDFAFAQRVLTRVRGSGPDYARRLQNLMKKCDSAGMVESAQALKRILENGQDNDEYDFFAF